MDTQLFSRYLETRSVEQLRQMANPWGLKTPSRKAEYIRAIVDGLENESTVKQLVASLSIGARNALALIKLSGGMINSRMLPVAVAALGHRLPEPKYYYRQGGVEELIRTGLVVPVDQSNTVFLSHYDTTYHDILLFCHDALLAAVDQPEILYTALTPAPPPGATVFRRPQRVLLEIIGILQAITTLGGLPMTKSGSFGVNGLKKLGKSLGWHTSDFTVDGFPFPDPASVLPYVLYRCGFLVRTADLAVVPGPVDKIAANPLPVLVRLLCSGFVATQEWFELDNTATTRYRYGYRDKSGQGRYALLLSLLTLPTDQQNFFVMTDIGWSLFDRIGELFSLDYVENDPRSFQVTKTKAPSVRETESREKLKAKWDHTEQPWLAGAFTTWLYFLGIVELGMVDHKAVSVRLTDLGRAVLSMDRIDREVVLTIPSSGPACIVQPNMETLVYLDRVTPDQLAFFERHAERTGVREHTAHYRLSRNSIYRGVEGGSTAEQIIDFLQASSERPLPQNVLVQIREWAALVERMTLRKRVNVLEFPDTVTRDDYFKTKGAGTKAGERYIVQTAAETQPIRAARHYDYLDPPNRCLSITEKGAIKLTAPPDLVIAAQLDQWAERVKEGVWRLTAATVSAGVGKQRVRELLKVLDDRSVHKLPRFLRVTLEAWAGVRHSVELAPVTILRCDNPEVFHAIKSSTSLKPFVTAMLGPDILLVDSGKLRVFREKLSEAGLVVESNLKLETENDADSH